MKLSTTYCIITLGTVLSLQSASPGPQNIPISSPKNHLKTHVPPYETPTKIKLTSLNAQTHVQKNYTKSHFSRGADKQLHRYFMANYYQFGGNIQKAHVWYNHLINDEAMSPYAYKGYLTFLHSLGQYNHIYTLMTKVDTLLPNDPDIQLIFAQVLEQAGQEQESHTRVIKLSHSFPLHEEICYAAAQIFIKRNQPENAILAIDTLLNTAPRKQNTFIFHYSKAIAQLSKDNKQQALESIKKSLELQPRFDRGWLLYSLIEEKLGNTNEALRGYAAYLNLAGKELLIEQHVQRLKQRTKQTGQDALFKNEQQIIFDKATHKHATGNNSRYIKELLTRYALLNSAPWFQS